MFEGISMKDIRYLGTRSHEITPALSQPENFKKNMSLKVLQIICLPGRPNY